MLAMQQSVHSVECPIDLTTPKEINNYIKGLRNKKTPEQDEIPNILIKNLPKKAIVFLVGLQNVCLRIQYFPQNWKNVVVTPIYKPGKPKDCPESYIPISLLNSFAELLEKILLKRIEKFLDETELIPHHQLGFH